MANTYRAEATNAATLPANVMSRDHATEVSISLLADMTFRTAINDKMPERNKDDIVIFSTWSIGRSTLGDFFFKSTYEHPYV